MPFLITIAIMLSVLVVFIASSMKTSSRDSRYRDCYEMMQEQCKNCLYKREYMKRQKDGEQDDED